MRRSSLLELAVLILILALAFYTAAIPHLTYPYPVHIDEWLHLANARAVQAADSAAYLDPFMGSSTVGLGSNLEIGFLMFWSAFQSISGLDWLIIVRWFPPIVFMATVLCVYVLGRREGYGLEAAFFASLVPTTVGILGPGFWVPVALALPIIPLSLFLVFNYRSWWSYALLFVFISFLLALHAATAVGLIIILAPYILLNLRGDFKKSLGMGLAIAMPFLALFPWIFRMLAPTAKELLTPQPFPTWVDIPSIIRHFGYLPIAASLAGCFVLAIKGGRKNYALVLGLLALLATLVVFFSFQYGVEIMYERGLLYLMLMLSILAGAGLAAVRKFQLPDGLSRKLPSVLPRVISVTLCLVLVGVTLAIAIPHRQKTPYYHMIDQADYEAFVWIKENINGNYKRALLDPWKATAFVAITQKSVYSRIHVSPLPRDLKAYQVLADNVSDTAFLKDNGISIVYTRQVLDNSDLIKVRENVYLLK
ncbi:MAG: hypothetical protein HY665_05410 [Chloroflexi bacterium]|nr:hypothetical protein [Chloroflexota bacterium]